MGISLFTFNVTACSLLDNMYKIFAILPIFLACVNGLSVTVLSEEVDFEMPNEPAGADIIGHATPPYVCEGSMTLSTFEYASGQLKGELQVSRGRNDMVNEITYMSKKPDLYLTEVTGECCWKLYEYSDHVGNDKEERAHEMRPFDDFGPQSLKVYDC